MATGVICFGALGGTEFLPMSGLGAWVRAGPVTPKHKTIHAGNS